MSTSTSDRDQVCRDQVFRDLYDAHFDAVLGFTLRRTDRAEDAADATSETFLVAWRRIRHVPPAPDARVWLYAVARRTLANQRRGARRRTALGGRLRRELAAHVPDISREVVQRTDVVAAVTRLSVRDREVLELHLWEGLEPREIADVLGLPGTVVRPRLSRARARLREVLGDDPPPQGDSARSEPFHRPIRNPGPPVRSPR